MHLSIFDTQFTRLWKFNPGHASSFDPRDTSKLVLAKVKAKNIGVNLVEGHNNRGWIPEPTSGYDIVSSQPYVAAELFWTD